MPKRTIAYIVALFATGFLLYANSFQGTFHFDDYGFIVNNRSLREIGHLSGIWNAMGVPTRLVGLYSFALNYQIHGLDVFGYHVTNTLIHCLTGTLIFWFLQLILSVPRMQTGLDHRQRHLIPFLAALIFIVHPVETQAVTYISQRFASLATLFYGMAVCFYLKARLTTATSLKRNGWVLLCVLSGVLGMFTKEIVITLPLMIIFLEAFLFGGQFLRRHKLLFVAIAASMLLIPAMFSFHVKSVLFSPRPSESHAGDIITYGPYLLTQLRVIMQFTKLFIFPVGQNLDYDFPLSDSLWEGGVVAGALILIVLLSASVLSRKRFPLISLGLAWYLITFLPNFIPRANVIFEHKMYLISIGLCVALAAGIQYFVKKNNVRWLILCGIILALGTLTFQRNKVWENDIVLWRDVVKKSPQKFRPHLNLGRAYLDYGQYQLAKEYFLRALAIDPKSEKALNNLGLVSVHFKDYQKALEYYHQAITLNPNYAKAYLNRGALNRKLRKKELALKDYSKALELNPKYSIVYINRGNIYASQGNLQKAIADYTKAIDDYVNYEEAFRNRGNAYRMLGKLDLALSDYTRAIDINPHSASAYYYRSLAFYDRQSYDEARLDALKAVRLGHKVPPDYLKALNQLSRP